MLRSYSAELNGSAITWLENPPPPLVHARVLVVVEGVQDAASRASNATHYDFNDLAGKLQWRGDAVAAQRGVRDAW